MTSCRLAYSSWHFEVVCCLHLQDRAVRVSSAEILGKDRVGEWNSEPMEVVVQGPRWHVLGNFMKTSRVLQQ